MGEITNESLREGVCVFLSGDLVCAARRVFFYAYTVLGVPTMASACVTPLAQRAIEDSGISATSILRYSISSVLSRCASVNASNGSRELYRAWTSRGWRTRADPWTSISGVLLVKPWVTTSEGGIRILIFDKGQHRSDVRLRMLTGWRTQLITWERRNR